MGSPIPPSSSSRVEEAGRKEVEDRLVVVVLPPRPRPCPRPCSPELSQESPDDPCDETSAGSGTKEEVRPSTDEGRTKAGGLRSTKAEDRPHTTTVNSSGIFVAAVPPRKQDELFPAVMCSGTSSGDGMAAGWTPYSQPARRASAPSATTELLASATAWRRAGPARQRCAGAAAKERRPTRRMLRWSHSDLLGCIGQADVTAGINIRTAGKTRYVRYFTERVCRASSQSSRGARTLRRNSNRSAAAPAGTARPPPPIPGRPKNTRTFFGPRR